MKTDDKKPSSTTPTTTTTEEAQAPKVRTRRLSTSLRAGLASGDAPPPPDGGDGSTGDGTSGTSDGGSRTGGSEGCFVTYGSLSTWSCR